MEKFNVRLNGNWVSPGTLAKELGVAHTTVCGWIARKQINYTALSGSSPPRYLVDRRTAPELQPAGRPPKKTK